MDKAAPKRTVHVNVDADVKHLEAKRRRADRIDPGQLVHTGLSLDRSHVHLRIGAGGDCG